MRSKLLPSGMLKTYYKIVIINNNFKHDLTAIVISYLSLYDFKS